jgi:rhodanese-related sulfurtransferase
VIARDISVEEFAARRRDDPELVVLDVREPAEWAAAHLEGSIHVPMGELMHRLVELDRNAPTAVLCHHGERSRLVASYLATNGFADVVNVEGGIEAYARRVDASIGRY